MFLTLFFSILLIFNSIPSNGFCQESAPLAEVPWDSIAAEIQIIESLSQPDSVKSSLAKQLLLKWSLTEKDYRLFYEEILAKPLEQQREFIERVKEILQSSIKQRNTFPPTQNK